MNVVLYTRTLRPLAILHLRGGIMQRNEYMEEISNKIRSGEPVGFLDAIAAINYQATLKAEREAAEAVTLRGRIKRWLLVRGLWAHNARLRSH